MLSAEERALLIVTWRDVHCALSNCSYPWLLSVSIYC